MLCIYYNSVLPYCQRFFRIFFRFTCIFSVFAV
nr:MAG TPA: hypothetical protein [Caudoviricetes sp.]